MRDIRPAPGAPKPLGSQPPRAVLPALPALSKPMPPPAPAPQPPVAPPANPVVTKANFTPREIKLPGNTVPVTNVHVETRIHSDIDHKKEPKRPLFFNKNKTTSAAPQPPKPLKPKRPSRVGHKERTILLVFFLLVMVAAGLAIWLFLPTGTVNLTLRTAPLLLDQKLTLRTQNTDAPDVIPGTAFFREVQVEGESDVVSTELVGANATGTVQLINHSDTLQKIKEHSRLVTKDGVLFYMDSDAFIPANGSIPVTVKAAEAGVKGNIDPQKVYFAALPDSARTLLYGEVTKAFTGGKGDSIRVVKDADLDAAKKAAGQQARAQTENEIRAELPKGWTILEESWATDPASFDTSSKVDDKVPSIAYKAKVTVHVMGYQQDKLENTLQTALAARLDKDYMLFPGPISHTITVDSVDWQAAQANITARVSHMTVPKMDINSLKNKLAGQAQKDALDYLQGLPSVRSANISLWPFWVHSLPSIRARLHVNLESDQPTS